MEPLSLIPLPVPPQCCQSQGICGEQYVSDVVFKSDDPHSPIQASRFRMQLQVGSEAAPPSHLSNMAVAVMQTT